MAKNGIIWSKKNFFFREIDLRISSRDLGNTTLCVVIFVAIRQQQRNIFKGEQHHLNSLVCIQKMFIQSLSSSHHDKTKDIKPDKANFDYFNAFALVRPHWPRYDLWIYGPISTIFSKVSQNISIRIMHTAQ